MDERIHLPGFFDRHVLGNVKILDFTGNLGVERGGIEMGNAPDAGASIDDAVPGAVNIVADRADDTQPGNDDTSFHGRLLVIDGTWRARSAESRVGKESVSTCRSRCSAYH